VTERVSKEWQEMLIKMVEWYKISFFVFRKSELINMHIYINLYIQKMLMQGQIRGKHKAGWITISTDEYESLLATIDILSRPSVMKKLRQAEKDKVEGKMKSLEQLKRELGL